MSIASRRKRKGKRVQIKWQDRFEAWRVISGTQAGPKFETKDRAIRYARGVAKKASNRPSELIIYNKDDSVSEEHEYK